MALWRADEPITTNTRRRAADAAVAPQPCATVCMGYSGLICRRYLDC